MPKKYFIVKQISKAEYIKQAEVAGNPVLATAFNNEIAAGAIKIAPKTWLGFAQKCTIEIPLEDEDE